MPGYPHEERGYLSEFVVGGEDAHVRPTGSGAWGTGILSALGGLIAAIARALYPG